MRLKLLGVIMDTLLLLLLHAGVGAPCLVQRWLVLYHGWLNLRPIDDLAECGVRRAEVWRCGLRRCGVQRSSGRARVSESAA